MLPCFTSGGSDHGAVRVRAVPPGRLAAAEADVSRMRLPASDELLLGVADIVGVDDPAAITARLPAKAGLVGERVHQPGLTPGTRPDRLQGSRAEHLSRPRRMLPQQLLNLVAREVAEAQRSRLDIEGAAPGDDCLLQVRMDAVVAHDLTGLDVRVYATKVALGTAVQQIPQGQQGGGLAILASLLTPIRISSTAKCPRSHRQRT